MPTWSDKLLQEVIRSILEAYYEPQFSQSSHGFRPKLGCHTALREVIVKGKGTKWFIEGDISAYFNKIDHLIQKSFLYSLHLIQILFLFKILVMTWLRLNSHR